MEALPRQEGPLRAGTRELAVTVYRTATLEALAGPLARCTDRLGLKPLKLKFSSLDPLLEVIRQERVPSSSTTAIVILTLDRLREAWDASGRFLGQQAFDYHATLLKLLFQRGAQQCVLVGPLRPIENSFSNADIAEYYKLLSQLTELARGDRRITFLDAPALAAELGEAKAIDRRFWFHYEAPFAPALLERLAETVASTLGQSLGHIKKVVVLDCDNTLWGGVVGEDGLDGIKLSPTDPAGRPYYAFQRQLVSLRRRGVLLCLCSKNNLADVREVFDSHPHSVLKSADFAGERVNWADKAKNLRELATELRLGLDSFVFIDDSDVECALVRSELPEVLVLQVPRVVSNLPGVMQKCMAFNDDDSTKEDALRAQSYVDDKRRELERARHTDILSFLRSLEIVVQIRLGSSATLARLVQLSARTNQFNLTTLRYSEAELASLLSSPEHIVLELDARDRFGVQGITGLCVVSLTDTRLSIDAFMLSCRVLGRKIEQGFLSQAITVARARFGRLPVRGRFIATPKNEQTRFFFKDVGFEVIDSDQGQSDATRKDISFELAVSAEVAFPSHLLLEVEHDRASGASSVGGNGGSEQLS